MGHGGRANESEEAHSTEIPQRPPQDRGIVLWCGVALPTLCLGQFAFARDALVRFARTLDAIFELMPVVRELLGHFVGPARYIATDCGPEHHGLTDLEFM